MKRALIIVDVQNDFVEGGSLAVTGGTDVAHRVPCAMVDDGAQHRRDLPRVGRIHHRGERRLAPGIQRLKSSSAAGFPGRCSRSARNDGSEMNGANAGCPPAWMSDPRSRQD